MEKEYLGDGVYVRVDAGWQVWLETSNGVEMTNQIALEPTVLAAFLDYVKRYRAELGKGPTIMTYNALATRLLGRILTHLECGNTDVILGTILTAEIKMAAPNVMLVPIASGPEKVLVRRFAVTITEVAE